MIIQIIHQLQEFCRTHGKSPNVLYLNQEHFEALRANYPEIFTGGEADNIGPLGLKIVIVPADFLQYPEWRAFFPAHHRYLIAKVVPEVQGGTETRYCHSLAIGITIREALYSGTNTTKLSRLIAKRLTIALPPDEKMAMLWPSLTSIRCILFGVSHSL